MPKQMVNSALSCGMCGRLEDIPHGLQSGGRHTVVATYMNTLE